MTTQADPFVRVYYRALRDPKFQGLSLAGWGLWTKLLVVADGMHPSAAPLPRWAEQGPLDELVGHGIVDLEGEDFYRIHGLAAERAARSEAAAFAADARWHGNAVAQRRQSERNAAALRSDASPLLSAPLLSSTAQSARNGSRETTPLGVGDATAALRDMLRAEA